MNKSSISTILGVAILSLIKKGSFSRKSTLDQLGFWGNEAAGIMFVCPEDNTVLLGHRSNMVREPGTAGIFGGKVDPWDDTPAEAAIRETIEETCDEQEGLFPNGEFIDEFVFQAPTFKYTTYVYALSLSEKMRWEWILNWENDKATWYSLNQVEQDAIDIPVHFGVMYIMDNFLTKLSQSMQQYLNRKGA